MNRPRTILPPAPSPGLSLFFPRAASLAIVEPSDAWRALVQVTVETVRPGARS